MKPWHVSMRCNALALSVLGLLGCGGMGKRPPVRPVEPAQVKPLPQPDPMAVHVCSDGKGSVDKEPVVRVEIRGDGAPALLCERFAARAGNPLEDATTDANVRSLFAEGRVEDVVVYKENRKDSVAVVYEVKIRKRVRTVRVRPVDGLEQAVADELVTEAPSWEDSARFDAMTRKAMATLVRRGYRRANIAIETVPEGEDEVNVTLVVEPGPRATVGALDIQGFSPARLSALSNIIRTKVGEPFDQELFERDVLAVTADLFDRGMITGAFSAPEIVESPDGSKVSILLNVTEGPVFKVRHVVIAGDLVAPQNEYLRTLWSTKAGAVFSRSRVLEDVEKVRSFHASRGTPCDVDIDTSVDPKAQRVDVTVKIKRRP